ncbi:type II toxin-antitoxin system PemK/MazF family toxin [Brockia lithotrophica]|uniref:mRNA interferase MazF n=1 Tax=Brockia lithotrophica TaxID=933949 RepID=A0A660L4L1_9BACL|nr:type II toxin-antitoxin system PemK/MazF family toxin [Brockia lithotrophica]RKQ88877.1 mRNA interferase MazF [Brockia lithotrophica]
MNNGQTTPGYIPQKGDIVWLDFSPQQGREIRDRRPAIVVSEYLFNKITGFALFCPITQTRRENYLFAVELPPDVCVRGFVLADQVRSFDYRARQAELICHLDEEHVAVQEVLKRLLSMLGVSARPHPRRTDAHIPPG